MKNLIFILNFILSSTSFASPLPSCKEIGIRSLNFAPLDWPNIGGNIPLIDYCITPEQAPEKIKTLLNDLKETHQKISSFWNQTISEVFGTGFSLVIRESKQGFLGSFYRPASESLPQNTVQLGVFPSWDGKINHGVYLHELGHFLADDFSSQVIPESLRGLSRGFVFTEALADILAISVNGELVDSDPQLPSCVLHARQITNAQNYSLPKGYFDRKFVYRRIFACCSPFIRKSASRTFNTLCDDFIQDNHSRNLGSWNKTPLDGETKIYELDTHQLGIPMQSFFKELSEMIEISEGDLLRSFVKRGLRPKSFSVFQCKLKGSSEARPQDIFSAPTTHGFFSEMRAALTPHQMSEFDRLWNRHRMDILEEIAEQSDVQNAVNQAGKQWNLELESTHSGPWAETGCNTPFTSSGEYRPECELICK